MWELFNLEWLLILVELNSKTIVLNKSVLQAMNNEHIEATKGAIILLNWLKSWQQLIKIRCVLTYFKFAMKLLTLFQWVCFWRRFFVMIVFFSSCVFRVSTMITLRTSCSWRRRGGWVIWWVCWESPKHTLWDLGLSIIHYNNLFSFSFSSHLSLFNSFLPVFPLSLVLLCVSAAVLSLPSLSYVTAGFPLSGDQPLGGLWSNRLSDRPHCLFHRHPGGAAGRNQIPSCQRKYPYIQETPR